ncbi:hypothetical protein GP486_005485 [Trichoglossum hirsutum]|uniref:Uncharacterized protein n=1 Tax=Trichoglossum hirsutum TaxID=265104 RepID=A0A9P8L937_9PEZI|nr:hypothetical protein GP486_005485 [Trichoglossum hirsutum]
MGFRDRLPGYREKHAGETLAQKIRELSLRQTQPDSQRPSRDYSKTARGSSGNAEVTRDVTHEQQQDKIERPKHRGSSNVLSRKKVSTQADRNKKLPEPRKRDDIEPNDDGQSLRNTREKLAHTVANLGEDLGSFETPSDQSRLSYDPNSDSWAAKANEEIERSVRLQGKESQRTRTRHDEEDNGSRATNVSETIELSRPLQGEKLQTTGTKDDDKIMGRISQRLLRLKLEHSSIVSTHFDREIPSSCRLEDIEMVIDGLTKALSRSRDEDAQKEVEIEGRLSKLEREKDKEKDECLKAVRLVLRDEHKSAQEEQRSAWSTKEKDYELQLHQREEAARQLEQQHKYQMSTILEQHQSKRKTMEDEYNDRIQQLENEKEGWEDTYRDKVTELEQLHQIQQKHKEAEVERIRAGCNDNVIQLEGFIQRLKNEHEDELNELRLQHQEDMTSLRGEAAQMMDDHKAQRTQMKEEYDKQVKEKDKEIAQIEDDHEAQKMRVREEYDEQMRERNRKIAQIEDVHVAQKKQMKNVHEAQQLKLNEDHNAYVVLLKKQWEEERRKWEEERRKLLNFIESLKEEVVKGDRFKAMSDRELARRFQNLTSDVDAFARFRWDDRRVRTWPFPDKAFLNSENQRRDKQYLFQNTIWVILYEKIFCTPFRVLGKEGELLEQQWIVGFGQDRKSTGSLAHGPMPTKDSEKWRYEKIKECLDATSQLLKEGDANYNVKRDYDQSVRDTIDDMLQELERIASVGDVDKQNLRNLVRRAAKFWLEVGQQRYRLFLIMSDSGREPSRSGQTAVDRDGTQKLVVVPELRRIGSGQGTGLENDELVADCKGVFSVFKFH